MPAPIFYKLTQCSPGTNIIYTDTYLGAYWPGAVLELNGESGTCYTFEVATSISTIVPVTVTATFNTCLRCQYNCFTITNCNGTLVFNVITDLSTYIGSTISIDGYLGECFSVVGNSGVIDCTDTIEVTGMTPCTCSTGCYTLENCDTLSTYITNTDLSAYTVGTTITVSEILGCLKILGESPTCTGAFAVTVLDTFIDCPTCSAIPVTCYTLTASCPGGDSLSFTVNNDLSLSVGKVIKVCPSDLPVPDPTPPINPGIPLVPFVPDDALFQYNLINCCDPSEVLIVTNTLYPYIDQVINVPVLGTKCWIVTEILLVGTSMGFIDLTGAYVYEGGCAPCSGVFPCDVPYIPELLECTCLVISEAATCDGAITLTTLGPITTTCEECLPPPPVCFLLTDCQDIVAPFIVCTPDLTEYVESSSIIKIEGCGDTCWSVVLSETCDNSICLNGAITEFVDCPTCLPPVPVPTPFALHARRIKPGYFSTNSCLTTEYIERVNCTFALEVYNQMIINRYGVTVCCDNDLDQWAIKKQVLDFELLTDPDLCKSTLNPFVPSCPDEPI